jgi:gluconate 2-dehydrogenase gamma chain
MGGQGVERREILRYIGIATIAASFPGFSRWAFACSHDSPPKSLAAFPKPPYQPLFLSAKNYSLVERLADMIIPEDDTPGAKQAGVAEFIDFMLANRVAISGGREVRSTSDAIEAGNDAQVRFLSGLNWLNARSHAEFKHDFMSCTSEQQNGTLEELAYKEKFKPNTEPGRAFFQMIRDYTVVGYYTTKIGLESIGYPGLQQLWPNMPGCSHPEDPEHLKLPKSAM